MHNAFSRWRRASSDGESEGKFCRVNFLSRQVSPSFVKNITLVHSQFFCRTCSRSKNFGNNFLRKFSIHLAYLLNVTWFFSRYLIDARLVQADKAFVRQLSRYVLAPLFNACTQAQLNPEHGSIGLVRDSCPYPPSLTFIPRTTLSSTPL